MSLLSEDTFELRELLSGHTVANELIILNHLRAISADHRDNFLCKKAGSAGGTGFCVRIDSPGVLLRALDAIYLCHEISVETHSSACRSFCDARLLWKLCGAGDALKQFHDPRQAFFVPTTHYVLTQHCREAAVESDFAGGGRVRAAGDYARGVCGLDQSSGLCDTLESGKALADDGSATNVFGQTGVEDELARDVRRRRLHDNVAKYHLVDGLRVQRRLEAV